MSEKLIKSEEIQSVQVYLENYAENENTSFSAGILEDESAHELNNTLKAVGDSSKDLVQDHKGRITSFLKEKILLIVSIAKKWQKYIIHNLMTFLNNHLISVKMQYVFTTGQQVVPIVL